jgi:hypothetical protein
MLNMSDMKTKPSQPRTFAALVLGERDLLKDGLREALPVEHDAQHPQQLAPTGQRQARETGDPDVLLEAHHCAWASNFNLGRFRASVEHIDAGAAIYDEARHARHRHQYMGHDPGVCLLSFNGPAQMLLGHLAQGLQSIEACATALFRLCTWHLHNIRI